MFTRAAESTCYRLPSLQRSRVSEASPGEASPGPAAAVGGSHEGLSAPAANTLRQALSMSEAELMSLLTSVQYIQRTGSSPTCYLD